MDFKYAPNGFISASAPKEKRSHFFCGILMFLSAQLLPLSRALAYPQFIGYGYTSCFTCHFNAFGGGSLNDYGRAISATVISDHIFSPKATEEDLANSSGFLGSTPLPDWYRPALGYRSLYGENQIPGAPKTHFWVIMQEDTSQVVKFGPNDKYFFSGEIGFTPTNPNSSDPEQRRDIISREYYGAMNVNKNWSLFAGFMDKVYGLRVPDHIAFSRMFTENAENDQVHGVATYYHTDKIDLGVHVFLGNLLQHADVRTPGASMMMEYEPREAVRVGFSLMHLSNEYTSHDAFAVHVRRGLMKGSAIISELGTTIDATKGQSATEAIYNFTQGTLLISQGFNFITTFEYYNSDIRTGSAKIVRLSPGLQYYPAQRIELRFDAENTRFFPTSSTQNDQWALLSQVHLWF